VGRGHAGLGARVGGEAAPAARRRRVWLWRRCSVVHGGWGLFDAKGGRKAAR
jgi:hypothetical protein